MHEIILTRALRAGAVAWWHFVGQIPRQPSAERLSRRLNPERQAPFPVRGKTEASGGHDALTASATFQQTAAYLSPTVLQSSALKKETM